MFRGATVPVTWLRILDSWRTCVEAEKKLVLQVEIESLPER